MSTSKNRRLAAILFADIGGYTSLMQKDEITANQNLEQFHQTLNEKVNQYKGKVINNYGDGCVCTFDSAVDAMHCAKDLQSVFQQKPKVPVRIGLHSGDVYFKDDNVYGDSVNIASRIESLGVASAILFSKRIKRDIANQTAFKVQSLGEFHFKNVEKTMEVFGLANDGLVVPKAAELKGKLKSKKDKQDNKTLWYAAILGALLFIGGLFVWNGDMLGDTLKVSPNISATADNTIVVFPFEVNGSTDIDYLGAGMVDLISTQLDEIPQVKSIDPNQVFNQLEAEPSISLKLDKANKLAVAMGADKFIIGSITQLGAILQLNATKYDSRNGQILDKQNIKQEKGQSITQTIDELIQQLIAQEIQATGQEMSSLAAITSHNLESLKAYLQGEQRYRKGNYDEAYQLFKRATDIDSTFALAWMRTSNAATWNQKISGAYAFRQWGKYRHKMPQKWQEFYETRKSYPSSDSRRVEKFQQLINRYGEHYAFVNGIGEALYHFNPVYGKSPLAAKPYLEKALALEPNNVEAMIHLSSIAIVEKNKKQLEEFLEEVDYNSMMYPMMQLSLLHFKDSVTTEELRAIINHPYFNIEVVINVLAGTEDGNFNFSFFEKLFSIYQETELVLHYQSFKTGSQGQEVNSFAATKSLLNLEDKYFPAALEPYVYNMPASLMVDPAFLPQNSQYEALLQETKKQDDPWSIYAAIKYAIALQREAEIPMLKQKLQSLATTPRRQKMVKHYDFSLQAFEAYTANDHDRALVLIDSAFQYTFGYWEIQYSAIDKNLMQANIYAQRGDYDKAISFFNNYYGVFIWQGEINAYQNYKLSDWYAQIGEAEKALQRCNLLLEHFQNCDEKYQPWVAEVTERRDRILNRVN